MALRNVETILDPNRNDIDLARIDTDVKDFLGNYSDVIEAIDDAKEYLRLLCSYRTHIERVTALHGANFLTRIREILGVGNNGIYSGNVRCLFELIQNVDDCDYAQGVMPELSVCFAAASQKIVLKYNEKGFATRDVFSITGIAEQTNDVDARRIKIGEKGIGFKSVFGIAKSVLIRSGVFSFRLHQDHFTIPEPVYDDGFLGCAGTELTLEFLSEDDVRNVKNQIIRFYSSDHALLCQNPVVFLNNLRSLKFIEDEQEILSFSRVDECCEEQATEEMRMPTYSTMFVRKNVHLHLESRGKRKSITGVLYSTKIHYDHDECVSRYGNVNDFENGRDLELAAYFPDCQCVVRDTGTRMLGKGVLYSYLPTKDEISVPIICHAPFKLGASREHIDDQNNNAWFQKTLQSVNDFIHRCYRLYCKQAGNSILCYLPTCNKHFFVRNDKNSQLMAAELLKGSQIVREKLFLCADGSYHTAERVVSILDSAGNHAEDILRLLRETRPYYISPEGFDPSDYGIDVIRNVWHRLVDEVILNPQRNEDDIRLALELVNESDRGLVLEKLKNYPGQIISASQLLVFSREECFEDLVGSLIKRVREVRRAVGISLGQLPGEERDVLDLIGSGTQIGFEELGGKTRAYFEHINGRCVCLPRLGSRMFCLPGESFCLIVGENPERQAIDLCRELDPNGMINVRLQFLRESAELDAAMDDAEPQEFLNKLQSVRQTTKTVMGRTYKRYLDLIQDSGTDATRYLLELIQNADDCRYPENEIPALCISSDGHEMILRSNECGFRVRDVKSITDIGESSRRVLLDEGIPANRIGEKGIGFKSVFKAASSVEIRSGAFHFRIEANAPTVPIPLPSADETSGTEMRFVLNGSAGIPNFSAEVLIGLCLCLRNLRRVSLLGHEIEIAESVNECGVVQRRVCIADHAPMDFYKVVHSFCVSEEALRERNVDGLKFNPEQVVTCYIPVQICRLGFPMYCGLPTKVNTRIAAVIDAPFKLTTSREQVAEEGHWNECVRREVYRCLLDAATQLQCRLGINVFHLFSFKRDPNEHIPNVYVPHIFSSQSAYLNENREFFNSVRQLKIIPVAGGGCTSADDETLRIESGFLGTRLRGRDFVVEGVKLVDFAGLTIAGSVREMLSGCFKIKKLKEDEFWRFVDVLGEIAELVRDAEFRQLLYSELANFRRDDRNGIPYQANTWRLPDCTMRHPIIPVISADGSTVFVSKDRGKFYFSAENQCSGEEYYIVNTSIMSRDAYHEIFDETLETMTQAVIDDIYVSRVAGYVQTHSLSEAYTYLLREVAIFNRELFVRIRERAFGQIPLKDMNGEISNRTLFRLNAESNVITGRVLKGALVNPECLGLAQFKGCTLISELSYRDLPQEPFELRDADISDIREIGIVDAELILSLAANDGRISDELIARYGIIPIGGRQAVRVGVEDDGLFPTKPVHDINHLRDAINRALSAPSFARERTVMHIENYWASRGGTEMSSAEAARRAREDGLRRYESENARGRCFCQICGQSKHRRNIEVNSIEREPTLYFPEMHLTLCLECSAYYKELRNNEHFMSEFLRLIRECERANDVENVHVSIPTVGDGYVNVQFTCRHLVEIQMIMQGREDIEGLDPVVG